MTTLHTHTLATIPISPHPEAFPGPLFFFCLKPNMLQQVQEGVHALADVPDGKLTPK
jgi:hypothetical protein